MPVVSVAAVPVAAAPLGPAFVDASPAALREAPVAEVVVVVAAASLAELREAPVLAAGPVVDTAVAVSLRDAARVLAVLSVAVEARNARPALEAFPTDGAAVAVIGFAVEPPRAVAAVN